LRDPVEDLVEVREGRLQLVGLEVAGHHVQSLLPAQREPFLRVSEQGRWLRSP